MATPMPSRAIDAMAGSTLGSTSRSMMRLCLAPSTSAARTNSRSDHAIVDARVMRAMSGTLTSAMAAISTVIVLALEVFSSALAKTATIDSTSTSAGIDRITLNSVEKTVSVLPRK